MNEHIESYLKQHYCRDYFNSYGETVEDDHYFMYREEVEGLIELVVRECIRCLQPLSRNHSMVGAAQDTIREHFGVE